jgi:hypothetical protein
MNKNYLKTRELEESTDSNYFQVRCAMCAWRLQKLKNRATDYVHLLRPGLPVVSNMLCLCQSLCKL